MSIQLFDIQAYLQSRGVRTWSEGKNCSPGWVNIQCVFCSDRSNHLGINLKSKVFKCWKCGKKGIATKIICRIDHVPWDKAEEIQEEFIDIYVAQRFQGDPYQLKKSHPPFALEGSPHLPEKHRDYLVGRGFDPDMLVKKYHLRATDHFSVRFKFRIIIPIIMDYRIVGFTSRDVTDQQELRYKATSREESVVDPDHWVYNIDSVTGSTVLIVEGPTDVWRMGDGTVAFLSTSHTAAKVRKLVDKNVSKVVLLFDAEEEARKRADKLSTEFAMLVDTVQVINLRKGDPASLSQSEADELRSEIFL